MTFCLFVWTGSIQAATSAVITLNVFPPAAGATTSGAGSYPDGSSVTVTASTTNCYVFEHWLAAGKTITNNPYTFTATKNEVLTAYFTPVEYAISAVSSPSGAGIIAGAGNKACGSSVILRGTPRFGFAFSNWTSSSGLNITNNPYKFTANQDEQLVANFRDTSPPTIKWILPEFNSLTASAAFVIEGYAYDNVGVASVYYNLNGTGWQPADVSELPLWFEFITLVPNGTNILMAYAQDAAGNCSKTNKVELICTAAGFAPVSLNGQLVLWTDLPAATNGSSTSYIGFDAAGYMKWAAFTNTASELGTYTYTPTGPNTGELVQHRFLPTQDTSSNGYVAELTFQDGFSASATDNAGSNASVYLEEMVPTVPPTLDGFVVYANGFISGYKSTNTFASSAFATTEGTGTNSPVTNSSGTYTLTPFSQVNALLTLTYTDPPSKVGTTNFFILMFNEGVSPPSGYYSSQILGPDGLIISDTGKFATVSNSVPTKFKGPASLVGWQAQVAPTGVRAPTFTRSFGKGTFASISPTNTEPIDVGIVIGNSRLNTNTGNLTFTPLGPPYAVGEDNDTSDITWKTSTTVSATATSVNELSGETANLTFRKSLATAPTSLHGHTITTIQSGKSSTFKFNYNSVTGGLNAAGLAGTYTYAPYSPVMALVTITPTGDNGPSQYMLLSYTALSLGSYVSATNNLGNWSFKSGTFSMK